MANDTGGREKLLELIQTNPEEAVRLLDSLKDKVVVPHHGGQKEIWDDDHRFKIVCCGRRFGKTVIGAKLALSECQAKDNAMVWWVAPTYKVVKRGYREVLRQIPRGYLTHEPPQDSAFDAGRSVVLKFKNGSRMEFYSAERPEGMLGEAVDFVVMDEAAIMGKSVYDQTIRPTLMDRKGGALMISTPRGRNWFYYMFLRGQDDSREEYGSWRFPSESNPYLHPDEIREMEESLPLLIFQQEVLADFVASAGAVFRFSDELVKKVHRPRGAVFVGIDLAKSHDFTVISAMRVDDMMPCGFERFNDVAWSVQKNRIKRFVKWLEDEGAETVTLVMDSTGVGDPIVEAIEEDGYDVIPINFTKHKTHMVTQLAKDLETGQAILCDKENIDEFENYTYKITEAGRMTYSAPEGQFDDCVAAKMLAHWGAVQEGRPNALVGSFDDAEDDAAPSPVDSDGEPLDWAEDFSDLYDEDDHFADDNMEVILVRDSPAEIMARSWAWNEVER